MFIKLLKEIPQMFLIAVLIWIIVGFVFIRNSKNNQPSFLAKHRNTLIVALLAMVLTFADVWLFVSYIPTHYKKNTEPVPTLSTNELLNDSSSTDTVHAAAVTPNTKDTAKTSKTAPVKAVEKIRLTNKASIRFYSHGTAEDIEATNSTVVASFNETSGQLKFTGLIRGFIFENEMMQEHFNDKDYMNSEAFPKTSFKGSLLDLKNINFSKDGNYPVTAEGALTIHGVTKNIKATGSATVAAGKLTLKSVFKIKRADFGINTDEIAEVLEITVLADFN